MLNILHITTFLNGGAGKALVDLVQYQKKLGYNVRVAANKQEYEAYKHYPEHLDTLNDLGVKTDFYESVFKRNNFLNNRASASLYKSFNKYPKCNLIHAHASVPAKVALNSFSSLTQKPKIIQTMHGWGLNKSLAMQNQDIYTMNCLDNVVALNNSGKELLTTKGVTVSKVINIPYGISTKIPPKKYFDKKIESFIKKNWHLKFLCIGEIGERKNQSFLFEALKKLESSGIKCCVVLIGPEQNFGYIKNQIDKANVNHLVYWVGQLREADSYAHYFDAVVLPSKSEGMPLSILEAFRAKIPFLGSSIPEFKDFIKHQKTGFLFNTKTTHTFTHLIKSYDKIKWQNVAQNAYEEFISKYILEKMGQSYDSLYLNLIDLKYD